MPTRKRLRSENHSSDVENNVTMKENTEYIKFKGKVHYCTSFIECAVACDNLLKLANEWIEGDFVVGFDMEWPVNYKTGPGKTAVIQISPNLNLCFILHVALLKNLPKGLGEFLQHSKVKITGINIKNDIRKLCRDFNGFNENKLLENCIDASDLANNVLEEKQKWSMEKLIEKVFKIKIDKDENIRKCAWNVIPLSKEQKIYAATDSYASLLLYNQLKEKPKIERKMRLRSSVPPEQKEKEKKRKKQIEEAEIEKKFIEFSGKIHYSTTFEQCAMTCDSLLKLVNEWIEDEIIVGFDMEWPFSFQTGPGKTAVIQISPNLEECYILHVSELAELPKGLCEFLHHEKVKITGVNIKNDVRKLCRDFGGFDGDKIVEKCIDCSVLANTVLPVTQRWSMEKLIDYVFRMKIDKSKKVRMSKWHVIPLTSEQQIYAAIDAYASLLLYHDLTLKGKMLEAKEEEHNFV